MRLSEMRLKVFCSLTFSIHVPVILLLLCFNIEGAYFLGSATPVTNGNEADRQALLEFKAKIRGDPLGILRSWNDSVHFCQWRGVKCGPGHQRVTELVLEALSLNGPISPYIGNLSFLQVLNLADNSFIQELPQEIGRLHRLKKLTLNGNLIGGEFSSNISGCSKLTPLYIENNLLHGEIPAALRHLSNLKELSFQNNTLSGSIPPFLGNLSSLEVISLTQNRFYGVIPEALGQLKNLTFFSVSSNEMSGMVPSSLFNLSNIRALDIGLDENKFTGRIPSFRKLEQLQIFNIYGNLLGSHGANDLNFLCSLTNAISLRYVVKAYNKFGGILPECIGNLSTAITFFTMDYNNIVGRIPVGYGKLINLEFLYMEGNNISGSIPSAIGRLQKLRWFNVAANSISGVIPTSLGNLKMLIKLYLNDNNLQGQIPPSLGKCKNLNALDLSNNNLSGSIPSQMAGLSSLSILLNLSSNCLTGVLPFEVGKLRNLGILDVSQNMLFGVTPKDLGSCVSLELLLMQGNFFHGSIPSSLSSLRGLTNLDLSRNNLTGKIPEFLVTFGSLHYLNLSYNNFEAAILVFSLAFLCWFRKNRKFPASATEENAFLKLSYQSILKATNGFSLETLVGKGSFGFVYKGVLEETQTIVAIKVLNLLSHGASRSFLAECAASRNVRHRNLVKILTTCSGVDYNGNDFKALVYKFMANGSLEDWLHRPVGTNKGEEAAKKLKLFPKIECGSWCWLRIRVSSSSL
ncbi:hypothetical protein PTKIN_Ptkin16aG0538300 [Pterospermum kingtungense]